MSYETDLAALNTAQLHIAQAAVLLDVAGYTDSVLVLATEAQRLAERAATMQRLVDGTAATTKTRERVCKNCLQPRDMHGSADTCPLMIVPGEPADPSGASMTWWR